MPGNRSHQNQITSKGDRCRRKITMVTLDSRHNLRKTTMDQNSHQCNALIK
jgi:hypothetical protein